MKKTFFILPFIFVFYALDVKAEFLSRRCTTGFACSINNLKSIEKQQNEEIIYFINNYFENKIQEPMLINSKKNTFKYKDLFVFNSWIELNDDETLH